MLYRLALAVGEPNVEDDGGLADTLSMVQFRRWAEFAEVEPFGEERGDLRAGIVASVVANVNRGKNTRPFKASDFMPRFERPKKQTGEQMRNIFAAFARAHNAQQRSG